MSESTAALTSRCLRTSSNACGNTLRGGWALRSTKSSAACSSAHVGSGSAASSDGDSALSSATRSSSPAASEIRPHCEGVWLDVLEEAATHQQETVSKADRTRFV
eukprot:7376138-Prymnesium_polylepis.1